MRFPCWINKATNTHSENVIIIVLQLQQWLHERVSILRYTYTHLVINLLIQIFNFPLSGTGTMELTTYGVLKNICIYYRDLCK